VHITSPGYPENIRVIGMNPKEETNNENDNTLDDIFKSIMGDSYVLARMLSGIVDEVKGKDIEYIRSCLPIEDGGRAVIKGNPEIPAGEGSHVTMDNFFQMRIPSKGKVNILLNIEGQKEYRPGYPIANRAMYYASSMIHDQKGFYFRNSHYEDIVKVYSIWLIMDPRKDVRNTIYRYRMEGSYDDGFACNQPIPGCDLMEIVVINIGGIDDRPETVMGMINSIFAKGMDDRQRAERLSEVYNIPDAEYIFDRMRGLSMTIDEEMHRGWKREGVDEALESGEVITKEQRIVDYVSTVNDLIKKGLTMDELIDTVPSDIRDDVRDRLTPEPEQ